MNWLIGERRKGREIRNANVLDFGDEKKKKKKKKIIENGTRNEKPSVNTNDMNFKPTNIDFKPIKISTMSYFLFSQSWH